MATTAVTVAGSDISSLSSCIAAACACDGAMGRVSRKPISASRLSERCVRERPLNRVERKNGKAMTTRGCETLRAN
jgi:hypothetical protein